MSETEKAPLKPSEAPKKNPKTPAQLELLAKARQKALEVRKENQMIRIKQKEIEQAEKLKARMAIEEKHKQVFAPKPVAEEAPEASSSSSDDEEPPPPPPPPPPKKRGPIVAPSIQKKNPLFY